MAPTLRGYWGGSCSVMVVNSGRKDSVMARGEGGSVGGIGIGGILVIVGVVLAIVWSLWAGIIIALIGLIAFGGFARGRWY
jgi:hypothetical protein